MQQVLHDKHQSHLEISEILEPIRFHWMFVECQWKLLGDPVKQFQDCKFVIFFYGKE